MFFRRRVGGLLKLLETKTKNRTALGVPRESFLCTELTNIILLNLGITFLNISLKI